MTESKNYMTTKIKTDKNNNFIEVESEDDFVKKTIEDQCNNFKEQQKQENYKKGRRIILWISLVIFLSIFWHYNDVFKFEFKKEIILGFGAGICGLFTRNLIFLSSGVQEKSGKNLYLAYLAYLIFIIFSSLLILSIISLKISVPNDLFYTLLLSLNFYTGLMTYSVLEALLIKIFKIIDFS